MHTLRNERDHVEIQPEPVQIPSAVFVQDQLHERRIVPEIAHRVVQSGGQKPTLIARIIDEHAPAFCDVERVGKYAAEPGKCR